MEQILVGNDLKIDNVGRKVYFQDEEISMPERTYRLFLVLAESAPNIVSHDELIKAVWPNTVVSDETLKQRVSRLRRLLNDAGETNDYFVAERGLGYRCTASVVKPVDLNEKLLTAVTKPKQSYWLFLLLIPVVVGGLFIVNQGKQLDESTVSPFLTADDYVGQATDYYYRFNPEANKTAIELLHQSIKMDPNLVRGYSGLSNSFSQGYYQYGEGEQWLEQAKRYAETAIEIDNKQPWGHKAMGLAQHLAGNHQLAMNHYKAASQYAEWWASPVNNLALVLMESGDLVGAYKAVIEAIKLGPKDPIPYLFLGLIYRDLEMRDHALRAINRSISFKPDYNLAQSYLAEYYLVQNELGLAHEVLTTSLDKHPYNQFAYWLNGYVALYQGNESEALVSFQQAARLGGRYQLPAKLYIALMTGARSDDLASLIQTQIEEGNQWFELHFMLALYHASLNDVGKVKRWLEKAVNTGMNQAYRFNHPMLELIPMADKQPLVIALQQQIQQQRKVVLKIEKFVPET